MVKFLSVILIDEIKAQKKRLNVAFFNRKILKFYLPLR